MTNTELDNWWSSLRQEYKCHIATKVTQRAIVDCKEATEIWLLIDIEKKQWIHDHCTDKHGMYQDDWHEGDSFSY